MQKHIIKKYAYMFEVADDEPITLFGIECGSGWHEIIDKTLKRIANTDKDKSIRVEQIKEKFGGLRIYLNHYTDEIDMILDEAEKECAKTCELCGKEGKLRNNHGWLTILCDNCNQIKGE